MIISKMEAEVPADESVVSFISKDKAAQKRKFQHRRAFVSVDYSSGSDGDVESEEETETNTSPVKKVRRPRPPAKKARSDDEESSADSDTGDEDENSPEEREEAGSDQKPIPGAGWADAMAKIIGRPAATTMPVVLSKSSAYQKAKEAEREEITEKQNKLEKKKEVENVGREKPQPVKKDVERRLQRIATRGVVQFFNAVGKQQKLREELLSEATTENKRIAAAKSISKGEFLDMLKTPKTQKEATTEGSKKPGWDVLDDDYMMGAEMKDWDERKEGEAEEPEVAKDSGSSSDED